MYNARCGIRYSRQQDPRITLSDCFGILTKLPQVTMDLVTNACIGELFDNFDLEALLFFLAFEGQKEVDWAYLDVMITFPLMWYDWHRGHVVHMSCRYKREIHVWDDLKVIHFCHRVCQAVGCSVHGS